jgi:hypothetical protein
MHGYGTPLRFKKDILSICAIDVEAKLCQIDFHLFIRMVLKIIHL